MKVKESLLSHIVCPRCKNTLKEEGDFLSCDYESCNLNFPYLENDVPILINEENSIFLIHQVKSSGVNTLGMLKETKLKSFFTQFIPSIGNNIQGKKNYLEFLDLLLSKKTTPNILVVGGSTVGSGMESIVNSDSLNLVETDIYLGSRTDIICDAHDIPFEDGFFDGVIIQAVLEHVVDPYRCVEEVHRVLGEDGLVYAETPFMQQVHMGRHDFTRFTHLGHRRLFRKFTELKSGIVCGPGMALAWSFHYFLLSFTQSKPLRKLITVFASFSTFFLKYFDYYLVDKNGSYDSASGFFFIGEKNDTSLSDLELIKLYKGAL